MVGIGDTFDTGVFLRTEVTLLDKIIDYSALYYGQSMVHGCGAHSGYDPVPALIKGGLESVSLFLGLVIAVLLYHPGKNLGSDYA